VVNGEKFEGYAQWSGTSFASPHVAGVVAAKAAAEEISGARAAGALLDVTGKPGSPREIPEFGAVVG
jgi:subtilisin family serine protease